MCQRFRSAQLKFRPEKCQLFQQEVHYLGHVISQHGVATDPTAVQNWKTSSPRCTQEVKSFLEFVGYYRRFCPNFATITSKEVEFQWGAEKETVFERLKVLLIEDTVASIEAASAVLSQMVEGKERVVAYYSKT